MSYCTESNFEIAPGLWTHNYTVDAVAGMAEYGCCQKFVCSIACPETVDRSGLSVSWGVPFILAAVAMIVAGVIIGFKTIKGDARHNFFVCGRTLPLWIVVFALLGQGLDSNATLGNVALSYKYAWWDGAMLPLGLGISLILNGLTISGHINRMGLLTLPDLFSRKYGSLMEVIVSLIEVASFTCLLAGNMVGTSLLLQFLFGLQLWAGVLIAGVMMATYTMAGGLFSIAYVDIPQAAIGFTGLMVVTIYVLVTDKPPHALPSNGFALDLGDGLVATTPGYAGPLNCTDPQTGASTCDNYAFPAGDMAVNPKGMTDVNAYAPFPNAILMNWATLVVLSLGNLCALDFQARSMAARSARTARWGNIIAGVILMGFSLPFGLLGGFARKYHGPDSPYAEFAADTCSAPLGLPSCAQWVPDDKFVLFKYLWEYVPRILGGWTVLAILCASMSTATGAILATSTVMAHNIFRKVPKIGATDKNLLLIVRIFTVPMTALACMVAVLAYDPGYLLVVAFDVVLAGCFVPLMAAIYWPSMTPNAGIISCVCGSTLRILLEFLLPKDGSLVAFGQYALHFGKAIAGLPTFMEVMPEGNGSLLWDPQQDTCDQAPMRDYTGLDSLLSPVFCLVVMLSVWGLERCMPGRDILFFIPKSWRQPQPLYQLTDDEALKEMQAELAAAADGDDVAGAMPASIDAEEKLKRAAAAAGKRPRGADDSAHAGRQALTASQLL
ncbi:Sodium:solute symporter family-domain-containing protein [Scenedesmus sp. NREL 46B-D3]|nr:Sodium:solute symporter family-domain-containing protein [Scenedesmus sp. NREL 46B-D3]